MTTLSFVKSIGNTVLPADQPTTDIVAKAKIGAVFQGDFKKPRNPAFLNKFMALVTVAFDYFEVNEIPYKGNMIKPKKDFDEFRKWLTIRAGFSEVIGYPDGGVRLRAKSISFAKMDDEEFSRVYNAVLDIILEDVVDMPRDQYEKLVDKVMEFA